MSGVFDLNGCVWERTTAYISNGTENLLTYGSSYASTTANTNGYLTLSTKYATVYPYNSSSDGNVRNYNIYLGLKSSTYGYGYGYGDAILETSTAGGNATSWNGDYSSFANKTRPFFVRGGCVGFDIIPGAFAFSTSDGVPYYSDGFRAVLVGV